jgi:hypothetical protein
VKIWVIYPILSNRFKTLEGLILLGLALTAFCTPSAWARKSDLTQVELCEVQELERSLRRTSAPFFPADPYSPESTTDRNADFQRTLAQTELVSHAHYDVKSDRQGKTLIEKTRNEASREFSRDLVGPQRNLGIAVVEIQGRPPIQYKAFSGPAHIKGFEDGVSISGLQPSVEREHDSEVKILTDLAKTLPPGTRGKITIYTERIPCPSCSLIIRNFKKLYPGIDVEVPKLSTWH